MSMPVDPWPRDTSPAPVGRRRGRVGILATALCVAVLGASGVAGAVVVSRRSGHPDTWDPRVLDLVAYVERERGLAFEHPVPIDFLDDVAFRKEVTDVEALDEKERAELRSAEAMLRAVGLLGGDVDLLAAGNELAGDSVVGLYNPDDERILLRGTTLDDERRSTLVHELTHALQDQHFRIGTYVDRATTSGQTTAYRAVAEADASAVEDAWVAALPAAARERLEAAAQQEKASEPKGVPEVFVELLAFPYAFGPDFLKAVVARDGAPGRNRLFTEPPTTEEHILLPETYLNRQIPQAVRTPVLKDGEKLIQDSEDDVGMLSLLVMLGETIDFGVAWPAVQGWAGDSFVAFERAGSTCVRGEVVFDQPAQAERFGRAFGQWSTGRPATQARNDRSVTFESCDPGSAAAGGRKPGHVAGIQGLALRNGIAAGLQSENVPPKTAVCIADGLIERLTGDRIATLVDKDDRDPAVREIQRTVAQLVPGCR